uniref:Uncharacterized protein n=1 Tax=Triticum urartu TaxID=4572 RepID=A0A8R7K1G2_TRIUA
MVTDGDNGGLGWVGHGRPATGSPWRRRPDLRRDSCDSSSRFGLVCLLFPLPAVLLFILTIEEEHGLLSSSVSSSSLPLFLQRCSSSICLCSITNSTPCICRCRGRRGPLL